uniref:Uncharacterized protein n=1 Tax=Siphoviridae sp. ctBeL15 TaxID=2825374 RepID=A0A8S5V020_9CAUD|nr:MAG TPA: hypothetical protein [Siphoviridae sp. ctBeL15]
MGRAERRRVVRKFRTAWRRSFCLQEGDGGNGAAAL